MHTLLNALSFLVAAFLAIGIYANVLNTNFPTLPGDFLIKKPGIRVYIPFASAILVAIGLTYLVGSVKLLP